MIASQLHATAIFCDTPSLQKEALQLSQRLELPLIDKQQHDYEQLLMMTAIDSEPGFQLSLQQCGNNPPGPVFAEFITGKAGHRRRFGGGKGQILARAVGIKGPYLPTIIDTTGGLGRDAFVLACLGCKVTVLERNPIIFALLENGLQRAKTDPEVGEIIHKQLQLVADNAIHYLSNPAHSQHTDVIYLDPMFPERSKSALVKKEMRLFKHVVGDDPDAGQLLEVALNCAKRRVTVKRPRLAPPLPGRKPSLSLQGKSTRYDIYIVPRHSSG